MIRDALIKGLTDDEIRLDILGESKQDMSLEEVLKFAEAKESGKRSAGRLLGGGTTSTAAVTSSYKQQEKSRMNSQTNEAKPSLSLCGHCGKPGHGRSRQERQRKCTAYNHTCAKCGTLHHHEDVCRRPKRKPQPSIPTTSPLQNDATAIFETLCSLSYVLTADTHAIMLNHHIYSEFCDVWEKRASDPQPFIDVCVHAVPSDAQSLGFPTTLLSPTLSVSYPAVADTGCQSCLARMSLLTKLGLKRSHLIPVTMKMTAANNHRISIAGAFVLRISGTSPSGERHETRQVVCFTDSSDRLFLSKQVCIALGMISKNFPTTGETCKRNTTSIGSFATIPTPAPESGIFRPCKCPRRQAPPPPPTRLPFTASEDNRVKLEKWLLEYYGSSTFNVCEHQPLPMMSDPPMQLMVDSSARPVAHHTPIPVPIHWEDDV